MNLSQAEREKVAERCAHRMCRNLARMLSVLPLADLEYLLTNVKNTIMVAVDEMMEVERDGQQEPEVQQLIEDAARADVTEENEEQVMRDFNRERKGR